MLRRILIGFIILFLGFSVFPQSQKAEASTISKKQLIIINKKVNKLAFYENGKLVKTYNVATGRTSKLTPEGTFYIREKIKNRPYYKHNIPGGDPRNPLGKRWLGLSKQENGGYPYAIHGNSDESSIGKYISGGCIRMHNKEVIELFGKVKIGAKVVITRSSKTFNQLAAPYYKNIDIKAPTFPTVSIVSDKSNEVAGVTEKGATVTVKIGSKKYTKKADSKGKFKVKIPKQKAGKKLYLSAKDKSGNISKTKTVVVKDKTAPVLSGVTNKKTYNKNVTISFKEGNATLDKKAVKTKTVVKTEGKHTVVLTDKAGNKTTVVFTIDKTAPVVSGVSNNALYNKDVKLTFNEGTAMLNGKAVKTGYVVKESRKHTLELKDAIGNKRTVVFTIDKIAPVAPKAITVPDNTTTEITGTAEAKSTITIKVGTTVIGTGITDQYGKFKVAIKPQLSNTNLIITATDAAKNVSAELTVTVK
ncbi:Ig-like domain-containing protein [Neobacillus sp. SuZ13]|uniref:Ig-like domain-containing protein n=1 Tax=Neobacillus sp. SuZ13 TaxID=3047875 RepID=UPI0024C0AD83|nr:Ig-like domain-containing protein [Neobacillus sp. SuZ13]WHY66382.1 Ig-like domain-containing protein [Neobacillus sp. SuZ13]